MFFLNILDLSLPLQNPVLQFSLILFLILFAPILLNKLKIPPLIGLILAGAVIGPNGFNLMLRNSSIILFGTVGLLYIMFLAGLEIDLADFKKNSGKSVVFGFYTFIIPMILGILVGYYFLNFPVTTSVLLASMFASHTLIAYPIVSKLGVAKNRAVNITVGGTIITDTLALLVLAIIVGISTEEITNTFWVSLGISVVAFGLIVMLIFPMIARWFFKKYDDNISQYIFVLGMVFLAAFLAEAAGIEAIIGAFLAGLALNRLIPHTSPLMNRIEFVGNALFIPFFLIGVGMLIDYRAFFKDFETILVAITMTVIATLAKFLAAFLTQKTFGFTTDERRLIFGLSNAQAAATLAAVLVGFNVILGQNENGEPIRLLSESILNGTILMILVTCTIASFIAQKGAQNIALNNAISDDNNKKFENSERILIPIRNIDTVDELINLALSIKSKKKTSGLYALNVVNNNNPDINEEKEARKILDKAVKTASSADNSLEQLLRYDLNIVNAINSVVKEQKITDLILGLHNKTGISDTFLGNLTEGVLNKCNTTTLIYKSIQPVSTVSRNLIIIPDKAEKELGFPFWLLRMWNMGKNTGSKLIFYASEPALIYIKQIHEAQPIDAEFHVFSDWNDFLVLSRDVRPNDNLVIIMSRKNHPSYNQNMAKIPGYLNRYFTDYNFIMIYPIQEGVSGEFNVDVEKSNISEPYKENLSRLYGIDKNLLNMFKKK